MAMLTWESDNRTFRIESASPVPLNGQVLRGFVSALDQLDAREPLSQVRLTTQAGGNFLFRAEAKSGRFLRYQIKADNFFISITTGGEFWDPEVLPLNIALRKTAMQMIRSFGASLILVDYA